MGKLPEYFISTGVSRYRPISAKIGEKFFISELDENWWSWVRKYADSEFRIFETQKNLLRGTRSKNQKIIIFSSFFLGQVEKKAAANKKEKRNGKK